MRRTAAVAVLGLAAAGLAACAPAQPPASASAPSYVVFFTPWSADLDDAAQGVVTQAATAARAAPDRPVLVEGFADYTTGSTQANRDLTRLRAQHVADTLAQRGVAQGRIQLRPRSSAGGTDPGVESRRVVIEIGG